MPSAARSPLTVAPGLGDADGAAEAFEFDFEAELIAGDDAAAEAHAVDAGEEAELALVVVGS